MPLIIPSELVKKHGVFQALHFVPITYQEFTDRQKAYKDHNDRIGRAKGVDLSREPSVVYFNRADVLDVLDDDPTYLTFMFSCADSPKYEGLRVMMCGMNNPGYPVSDNKIFEGYRKGDRPAGADRHQFEVGRYLFEKRLDFYNDKKNWRGVKNNIKEKAPQLDPLVKLLRENDTINRLAVYLADMDGQYNVMLAFSIKDFHDLLPISDSKLTDSQVYDNSTQCC